jgi:hypothetical protein
MTELSNTVSNGFIIAFREFEQRVHTLSEKLSEEQFWTKPYPYGNSFGHLTLHLIGNLSYYIGTQIGKTGYVRDRDREFTDSAPPSKAETLRRLDETVGMVIATLQAQTDESWSAPYEAVNLNDSIKDRFGIVLRCTAHFYHHIGQMIYLEKEFSR